MNKLKTKVDIVYNDYAKKDIIILHIADIHFNINTSYERLNKIKAYIFNINPDYLIITGDLIDTPNIIKNKDKIKELLLFLTDISSKIKIIISLGNHDIFMEDDIKFYNRLNELYNIYVLNNYSYYDDYIYVTGFTLPSDYYYNITGDESKEVLLDYLNNKKNLISKLPKNIPKIALIHSPRRLNDIDVLKKLHEYDLVLCGHMHNGMIPDFLDFLFKDNMGLIAPNKKLFPEFSKGKKEIKINKLITIIVNGGITKLSLKSSKFLSKWNFIYNTSFNKVIIRKKRGIKYE